MSLSSSFGITTPRLQILTPDYLSVQLTYYLPIPTKDGIHLLWDEKGTQIVELANGSKRKKVKGYSPKVQLKYSYYNDLPTENVIPIGTANNQMPTAEDLVNILSTYGEARLQFSPSTADPFFRCLVSKAPTLSPAGNIAYKNFELELVSRDLFATSDLSAAIVS